MEIKNLTNTLPWHPNRIWGKRQLSQIKKIIIHQELGESSIEQVNDYHITPGPYNHISEKGCPHFCYHYGIRKNGEIVQANELSDVVWHCTGQNMESIGIMLQGNFAGPGHETGTSSPTPEQMQSIAELIDHLQKTINLSNHDVWGHYHFGKPACPGHILQDWIEQKRTAPVVTTDSEPIKMTITEIQNRLKKLGYNTGPIDGIMGVKTQAAIYKFQRDNKLEVDGIVGPQTWNKLLMLSK